MPFLRVMAWLIFSLYAWIIECCCRKIHITNSNFAQARSCIFWIFFNSCNFAQFRTLHALRTLCVFMPYIISSFIKLLTLRILAPYASYLRDFVCAFWMPSLHVLGALLTHLKYILFTSYLFVLKNLRGWICSLPKTLTFPSLLKTLQTVLIFCWLKENLES